jgi:hypothetical protein
VSRRLDTRSDYVLFRRFRAHNPHPCGVPDHGLLKKNSREFLGLSTCWNPPLRQNGQHRNQRRSHGLSPLLHQAYSFQHSAILTLS